MPAGGSAVARTANGKGIFFTFAAVAGRRDSGVCARSASMVKQYIL